MSVVGFSVAQGLNAREVAMKAAQEALDQIGTNQPAFGIALISREYALADASMGLTSLLGDIPLWGFTTIQPFTSQGEQHRSIVIALFGGSAVRAYVNWLPEIEKTTLDVGSKLLAAFTRHRTRYSAAIVSMDASISDYSLIEKVMRETGGICGGCLPAGDHTRETTFQIAKNQFGTGSASVAMLGGKFRMGMGFAHGWEKTGLIVQSGPTDRVWLQELDGQMPVDLYSRKFECQPGQWLSSPQAELLRLYPLGIDSPIDDQGVRICAPLRVEASGAIRYTGHIPPHNSLHLMVGNRTACLRAVERAAQQARVDFMEQTQGKTRPLLALVFIDLSWRYLFETQPQAYLNALKAAVGDIPLIGSYSLGQLNYTGNGKPPQVQNQGVAIHLIGEEAG